MSHDDDDIRRELPMGLRPRTLTDAVVDDLQAEIARLGVQRDLLTTALLSIANGWWNAGRPEPITFEEYAHEVLRVLERTSA
jgi:hypothetical protein